MVLDDTIVALCSSALPAPRMIVRVSGPAAFELLATLNAAAGRQAGAAYLPLAFSGLTIDAWVYGFVSPRSYSGQDVVELHIPGNPLLAQMLIDHLLGHGARSAEPGEFTARGFFNQRMDLSQAEGVAATIAASSDRALEAARQLLAGGLSSRVAPLIDQVADVAALLEAAIDFADEHLPALSRDALRPRIKSALEALRSLESGTVRFEALSREPTVLLTGRPNAGKSTLLNALCGLERAVVSALAGTTRDVIWASALLPHGSIRISDAAGLVEPSAASPPGTGALAEIERQMQQRAREAIAQSDVVVLVIDATDSRPAIDLPRPPHLVVRSKIDLGPPATPHRRELLVSARDQRGLDALRESLDRLCFGDGPDTSHGLALNARHLSAIATARASLERVATGLADGQAEELLAFDLREAIDALGSISGQVTSDDLLGRVFATFCIGK